MKKNNKKGFTLAELLIVVAIIAVLVAIAIPIFTSQLEKSREATDAANIRAAYAEIMAEAITGEPITEAKDYGIYTISKTTGTEGSLAYSATVTLKQQQNGWQNTSVEYIGGVDITSALAEVGAGKVVTITYTQGTDAPVFAVGN